MKITKDRINLEEGITKEWLITNGIGGYSSSTIIGTNTRKYHGLLVAPLTPPARRFVMLSKIDECVVMNKEEYPLYTNICKNYVSDGYKYLEEFEKDYLPTFKFKVKNLEIEKVIVLEYGENTVGVLYKIKNGKEKAVLKLAPIINFRDFHQVNEKHKFELRQNINKNKIKIVVDGNSEFPLYMNLSEGNYITYNDKQFNEMFYIEEEKRGFCAEENHAIPGIYEVEIKPNEEKEISFIFSMEENIEEKNAKDLIASETKRINDICKNSGLISVKKDKKTKKEQENEELIKTFLIASDNFIVYRPNFRLYTMIAGYPWFLDWGRDTLISFEGNVLIPKRYDIARQILLTTVRDIKFGLVPNGYSGYDNRPLYNSCDASLLLFEQVQKYIDYTKDYKFVKENIYEKLEEIINSYCNYIDVDNNNIYLDDDGLIVSGTENTQNTWMDVKYNNVAITPRNGKAVEINSLWYNANVIMANLAKKFRKSSKAKKYSILAENCKKSFIQKFYNNEKKCLYDVVGDPKIRPNQLFALSLTNPVVEPNSQIGKQILKCAKKNLLNEFGLKTLAEGEENYVDVYEGNEEKRDKSYHQGITWPWLLGLYYNSLKNMAKYSDTEEEKEKINKEIDRFVKKVKKTFEKEIYENGCIGSIAEIYDSVSPQLPKGTFAQAWSISEVFRIILDK